MNDIQLLARHGCVDDPDPRVIRQAKEKLMSAITHQEQEASSRVVSMPERSEFDEVDPAECHEARGPKHLRLVRYVASAAAVAVLALIVNLSIPRSTPSAAATELNRLAQTAIDQPIEYAGSVAHTRSTAKLNVVSVEADGYVSSTVEASEREIWIAPDGSGRIIEKRGDRIDDEVYGVGQLKATSFSEWPTTTESALARLRSMAAESDMRPRDYEAFVIAGDLLAETAAPPAVRAALFGAIAQLDGVRFLGEVDDHLGRSGVGFEIDSDADHDVRSRLIFEPVTSDLLEAQQGSITGGYGDSGWTAYTLGELVEDVPKGGTPTMLRTNE